MLRKIGEKYGEGEMVKAQDKALRRGSKYFVSVLKQISKFSEIQEQVLRRLK